MKKYWILLLFPCLFWGCKGEGPGFDINYLQDFEIPAGLNVFDTHVFTIRNIPTNKAAFLTANGIQEQDILNIRPKTAQLSINFSNVDFYFVREAIVEIYTANNATGFEVFFREQIPQNTGFTINLIPSLPQVTNILLGDRFNIRIELKLRDISPQFIDARLNYTFFAELAN